MTSSMDATGRVSQTGIIPSGDRPGQVLRGKTNLSEDVRPAGFATGWKSLLEQFGILGEPGPTTPMRLRVLRADSIAPEANSQPTKPQVIDTLVVCDKLVPVLSVNRSLGDVLVRVPANEDVSDSRSRGPETMARRIGAAHPRKLEKGSSKDGDASDGSSSSISLSPQEVPARQGVSEHLPIQVPVAPQTLRIEGNVSELNTMSTLLHIPVDRGGDEPHSLPSLLEPEKESWRSLTSVAPFVAPSVAPAG